MKYTKELLEPLVAKNVSVAGVLRDLGLRQYGSIHSHISKLIKRYALNTSHFTGLLTNSGSNHVGGWKKLPWEAVLVHNTTKDTREAAFRLRRALLESGCDYICEDCHVGPVWNNKELRLQVDHRDGNWRNNTPENIRFLCPNCHSQTPTHSGTMGGTSVTSAPPSERQRRLKRNAPVADLEDALDSGSSGGNPMAGSTPAGST